MEWRLYTGEEAARILRELAAPKRIATKWREVLESLRQAPPGAVIEIRLWRDIPDDRRASDHHRRKMYGTAVQVRRRAEKAGVPVKVEYIRDGTGLLLVKEGQPAST